MIIKPYSIVIPARYGSSRFPGKPLHPLNGKPMILHTVMRAQESNADTIIVATDDERIAELCAKEHIDVLMTCSDHPSGTDRIAEVAHIKQWAPDRLIVGLQADEPATAASHLDLLAHSLSETDNADMATLCMPIRCLEDYQNPHRVKVVLSKAGMALYFSRASIPARRSALIEHSNSSFPQSYLHIGLYAYRCGFLNSYTQFSICDIEQEEQLEQLRVIYHGGRIKVTTVDSSAARGVDHPDDVSTVEEILATF